MTGWRMARAGAAFGGVMAVTLFYTRVLPVTNSTTVALTFLLVVLLAAATCERWIAIATALAAVGALNFFFLPPVGTFTIADPQNWVALVTFLAVSLVASHLSLLARARAEEALARRDEVARLFDLSRDVLLVTDGSTATTMLVRHLVRRFGFDYAAICLPSGAGWSVVDGGEVHLTLAPEALTNIMHAASAVLEFDAKALTYAGHQALDVQGREVRIVPLRLGTRPVGLLAAAGGSVDRGTLDALAGLTALAIERAQFLDDRKASEVSRQSEALKSALLASLAHDLRTPLTAIRVAATNLRASWLSEDDRREQADLVLAEIERLTRLFQNILETARIDAGAVVAERRWVHPAEIVEAARAQVEHTLGGHPLEIDAPGGDVVSLDPRLTAAALAHLLENAAQYSPAGAPITVRAVTTPEGVEIAVRDRGRGLTAADLPHLFDRFYRGAEARRHAPGTGMGLSIARGLLAAEQGRIWAENAAGGGACFTIAVPAPVRQTAGSGAS